MVSWLYTHLKRLASAAGTSTGTSTVCTCSATHELTRSGQISGLEHLGQPVETLTSSQWRGRSSCLGAVTYLAYHLHPACLASSLRFSGYS
jgi:hypothetical protein